MNSNLKLLLMRSMGKANRPSKEAHQEAETPFFIRKGKLIKALNTAWEQKKCYLQSTKLHLNANLKASLHSQLARVHEVNAWNYVLDADIAMGQRHILAHCVSYPRNTTALDEPAKRHIENLREEEEELWKKADEGRQLSQMHGLGSLLTKAMNVNTAEPITRAMVAITLRRHEWELGLQEQDCDEDIVRPPGEQHRTEALKRGSGCEGWCPVLKSHGRSDSVRACYIYPPVLGWPMMEFLFGPPDRKDVISQLYGPPMATANGILLHHSLGCYFEDFRVTIVPADSAGGFQMLIMDEGLLLQTTSTGTKFRDLHRRKLEFKGDVRPGKKFLYWHYLMAVYRMEGKFKDVADEEWKRDVDGVDPDKQEVNNVSVKCKIKGLLYDAEINNYWGAGGAWLRKSYLRSMSAYFGHEIGDLDPEAHGLELGDDDMEELKCSILGINIGVNFETE